LSETSSGPEADLIAEQLRHTIDLLHAELSAVKARAQHDRELLIHRIAELEKAREDHESRIRSMQDGVTSFKVWSGLASGGSSVVAIAALVRAVLGG